MSRHWPVFVMTKLTNDFSQPLVRAAAIGAVAILSVASEKAVERPFRAWQPRHPALVLFFVLPAFGLSEMWLCHLRQNSTLYYDVCSKLFAADALPDISSVAVLPTGTLVSNTSHGCRQWDSLFCVVSVLFLLFVGPFFDFVFTLCCWLFLLTTATHMCFLLLFQAGWSIAIYCSCYSYCDYQCKYCLLWLQTTSKQQWQTNKQQTTMTTPTKQQ